MLLFQNSTPFQNQETLFFVAKQSIPKYQNTKYTKT